MMETETADARVHKFTHCGDETYVYQHAVSGEIEYHGSRCNDRFCLVCGQIRSRKIANSLSALIEKEQPLFITFTVRGLPGDTLQKLLDHLNEGWKQLKRLELWTKSIRGGAVMTEIKWSTTSGGHWHPHLHIMAHGKWIDQNRLRAAWYAITRDSHQVVVKRVRDVEEALGYVTKYASKPMDGSFTMRPHLLREAIRTLKGRRLCACFGTWYGTPLNDTSEDTEDETEILTQWRFIGTVRDLEYRAGSGDAEASKLLASVERAKALRYALTERCRSPASVHGPPDPSNACITAATADGDTLYHHGR